jgi:hypothetical protein
MADLFDQDAPPSKHAGNRPLADRCRPTKITDVIGQQKLIGSDGSLTIMLESGNLPSIIFWGTSRSWKNYYSSSFGIGSKHAFCSNECNIFWSF